MQWKLYYILPYTWHIHWQRHFSCRLLRSNGHFTILSTCFSFCSGSSCSCTLKPQWQWEALQSNTAPSDTSDVSGGKKKHLVVTMCPFAELKKIILEWIFVLICTYFTTKTDTQNIHRFFLFYFILTNFGITSAQLKILTKSGISLIEVNFLRSQNMWPELLMDIYKQVCTTGLPVTRDHQHKSVCDRSFNVFNKPDHKNGSSHPITIITVYSVSLTSYTALVPHVCFFCKISTENSPGHLN